MKEEEKKRLHRLRLGVEAPNPAGALLLNEEVNSY